MKKKHLIKIFIFLSMVALNYVYPWTLISNYNEYGLFGKYEDDISYISVGFNYDTSKQILIIPFIYKKIIVGTPYTYRIGVTGNFDKVEDIKGYFATAGKRLIDIDIEYSFSEKMEYESFFRFNAKDYIDLDWHNIQDMKLVLEFVGVKDGKQTTYERNVDIEKRHFHSIGSHLFAILSGV